MERVMVPQPVAKLFGVFGFCKEDEWELVRTLIRDAKPRKAADRLLRKALDKLGFIDDDDEPTDDGTQAIRFLGAWPDWTDSDDAEFVLPDGRKVQDAWDDDGWDVK